MIRPVDAVIEFLETEQTRGVTHVLLDDGARDGLRELYRRAQTHGKAVATTETPAKPSPPSVAGDSPSSPVVIPVPAMVAASGTTKNERLASLRQQAESWGPANILGSLRKTMVFATGNPEARLMLVGEAPGYEEEKKGEPFVGPAGQKLDDILRAMGISRAEVYISNIIKFRPAMARQTTNNRKPNSAEIAAFMPFIRAEIDIIRPACIIALGQTAAHGLLEKPDTVGDLRGLWHEFEGIPVRVTYHPSHLLRSDANHEAKRMVWEDMLSVMDHLRMPISEKQRRFFQPKT